MKRNFYFVYKIELLYRRILFHDYRDEKDKDFNIFSLFFFSKYKYVPLKISDIINFTVIPLFCGSSISFHHCVFLAQ